MKPHYSMLQNILRFGTSHEVWKLVFGVPNAKNLAFDTPDTVALRVVFGSHCFVICEYC